MSTSGTTSDGSTSTPTSLFAITAKPPALRLAAGASGAIAFTVSFTGSPSVAVSPFLAHANLVPQGQMPASWLTLEGESHRKFAPNSTEVYTVRVAVPAGTTLGSYTFRLDMVGDDVPDEQYTQGPTIALEVVPGEVRKRKLPSWWWIVAAAVALLIIVVVVVVLLSRRGGEKIPVPDVVTGNLTQDQAQLVLERACSPAPCFVVAAQQQLDLRVPRGRVISTSPSPGSEAAKGSTVTLFVSAGPPIATFVVPTRIILQPVSTFVVLDPDLRRRLTPSP